MCPVRRALSLLAILSCTRASPAPSDASVAPGSAAAPGSAVAAGSTVAAGSVAPAAFAPVCHDGWCWENPLPTGEALDDVAALGGGEAWIARETTRGTSLFHVTSTGVATVDVKRPITSLAHAGKDVWAATRDGLVMHLESGAFVEIDPKAAHPLRAIWASAPNDVWAVGDAGTILHFDGRSWAKVPSPRAADLFGVRGSSSTDVWIAGDGVILHFDGRVWSVARDVDPGPMAAKPPKESGYCGTPAILAQELNRTLSQMRGIMVLAKDDVWFTGGSRRALHFDGSWSEAKLDKTIDAMWSSPSATWGVGDGIQRLDGSRWTRLPEPSDRSFTAIDGAASDDIWAVGWGSIFHFDGTAWQRIGSGPGRLSLTSMWAGRAGAAWAVGENATMLRRTKGAWEKVAVPIRPGTGINAIGGADNDDLWAFPRWEKALHWDGRVWTATADDIAAFFVRAPARDDVWAVASDSLSHWDGRAWTVQPKGEILVEDLWAPSKGVAWATGRPIDPKAKPNKHGDPPYDFSRRVLARWNGLKFVLVSDLPDATAAGISGLGSEVWIAGDTIQKWDGTKWSVVRSGTRTGIPRAIHVRGRDDVLVWGAHGIERLDRGVWTTEPLAPVNVSLAFGATDLFAWSRDGEILRHDP